MCPHPFNLWNQPDQKSIFFTTESKVKKKTNILSFFAFDEQDCRPTMFLKDVSRISDIEPQLSPGSKLPHPLPDLTPQPGDQAAMMTAGTPTVPTTARGTTPTTTPNLPPRPQFSYDDVNTANMATIGNLCTINDQVILFYG